MHNESFMRRCLELAEKGRGFVGMNPMVGAVLVRDGHIIAEGYYRGVGTDHAEVDMIKNCDQKIQQTDTLYVNLEPCCHQGNTPPCTEAIIAAGIQNIVVGMKDPDSRVAGQGIQQLKDAGITLSMSTLRAQCERLNRGYISLRTQGRPYITLKRAQTREGYIANPDGSKLCITSQEQNTWSHTHLRTTHDAILVGVGTVLADNPELTIRLNKKLDHTFPQPLKIILDPELRIPQDAKVVGERTIIVTNEEIRKSGNQEIKILEEKGVSVLCLPLIDDHFDWDVLWKKLQATSYKLQAILVEGGSKTWAAFTNAGIIDEEVTLIGH